MCEDIRSVVIDNGSFIKAGFGGEDAPRIIFPSIIGKRKINEKEQVYVGDEVLDNQTDISMIYDPIQHGIITNWDHMEKIWQHTFYNQLVIAPEEHPVLLTEIPKADRQKMTQIMFETFNVPAMWVGNNLELLMMESKNMTGVSLCIGEGVSYVAPIYEGYWLSHATFRMDLGGRDLTEYLMKMLNEKGYCFQNRTEREIVRDIKEQLAYVALDFDEEMKKDSSQLEKLYDLPNGQVISIGNELFRCGEALSQPSLIGFQCMGIAKGIEETLSRCEIDIRYDMAENYCNKWWEYYAPWNCGTFGQRIKTCFPWQEN